MEVPPEKGKEVIHFRLETLINLLAMVRRSTLDAPHPHLFLILIFNSVCEVIQSVSHLTGSDIGGGVLESLWFEHGVNDTI
jgi:hypothetical protein